MRRIRIVLGTAALVALVSAVAAANAAAAAPTNDDFANATTIDPGSLPYATSVSVDEATSEPGEPAWCAGSATRTSWYVITPSTDGVLRIRTAASFYSQFAVVYEQTGSGFSGLSTVACVPPWQGSHDGTFSVASGRTYVVQAGSAYSELGSLDLSLEIVPPPVNDDFANAAVVERLPFSDTVDSSAGTVQAGEPVPSCSYAGPPVGTVWYRWTAPAAGSVSATTFGSYPTTVFAAYTGDGPGTLVEQACRVQYGRLTMQVEPGVTYSFLVGSLFGVRGRLDFQVDVAPSPVASIGMSIADPSVYDTVQFYDMSWDPGEVGIQSRLWDFGDGATSTDTGSHRYLADGDYTATLRVTTPDGRTALASTPVRVRTHDVAIGSISVPSKGRAGRTETITAGVGNARYPEKVQVQLLKSVPGGWETVGVLTQSVPVKGKKKTTPFTFSYTFTVADRTLGKVTFQLVASIEGARDAIPADNIITSLPIPVG